MLLYNWPGRHVFPFTDEREFSIETIDSVGLCLHDNAHETVRPAADATLSLLNTRFVDWFMDDPIYLINNFNTYINTSLN